MYIHSYPYIFEYLRTVPCDSVPAWLRPRKAVAEYTHTHTHASIYIHINTNIYKIYTHVPLHI